MHHALFSKGAIRLFTPPSLWRPITTEPKSTPATPSTKNPRSDARSITLSLTLSFTVLIHADYSRFLIPDPRNGHRLRTPRSIVPGRIAMEDRATPRARAQRSPSPGL